MTLFHKRGSEAKPDEKPATAPITANEKEEQARTLEEAASLVPKVVTVSLSAELKSLLDQPLDPRVDRILQTINDGKIAATPRVKRADEQEPPASEPNLVDSLGEL